ncbi:uncharacterized protein FFNC_06266 [Fusarium fujikuroi]|nr:uncharacterized protein FFNC_06266 [Fusarium fujikuroi]
MLKSLLKTLCL